VQRRGGEEAGAMQHRGGEGWLQGRGGEGGGRRVAAEQGRF